VTGADRITCRPRPYPRAPLVEDVDGDSLVSENRGRQWVLYVDQLVVLTPRRVVVRRLDARDVVAAVRLLCESSGRP
jgi:hypothetical protein